MQRYFISPEQFQGERLVLIEDEAHHIIRVMRMQPGEMILCCDGLGREVLAQIESVQKDSVSALIVEDRRPEREASVNVWIAQSLPKGDKMETVIQRGTEIGAARFIPFGSSRGIVKYDVSKERKKLQRWEKIAKEAAEQSQRVLIPTIDTPMQWMEVLQLASQADLAMICYEKEGTLQLKKHLSLLHKNLTTSKQTILLMIGPEGGFSEQEIEQAEASGWSTVSLGKRILRTETAALVGLSCIFYEYGEMGD